METVVYGVLKEEKQRNLEMQKIHSEELALLRKGSISQKRVGTKTYYYLKYRQGERVISEYIGSDPQVVKSIKLELERRKRLQAVMKRLKEEHKQICKVVKD